MPERGKNILVIDDQPASLNAISAILEDFYEVSLAKNAEIAETILQTAVIDLILLDMEMPGISGPELLQMIRDDDNYYYIPVIIVSSHGTSEVIVTAQKLGVKGFVVKPVVAKTLLDKVNTVLKYAPQKITTGMLVLRLNRLANACTKGNSGDIKAVLDDLEQYYYNRKTDAAVAEIIRETRNMEYK